MKEMTKAQIQERQLAIWNRIDELDEAGKTRELTAEEVKEQRSLVDESAKLSTRAKALASGAELAAIKCREDKGKELREMIADCFTHKRAANATTILANAITTGDDQNEKANIPYSINDVKFTVEGEVTKVAEQALNFANITTSPKRVCASVPVSRRAVAQAAFDIIGFLTFKFTKGWAMFRALHVYAHGAYRDVIGPFATVTVKELTLDENIGKNLAKEVAEMYDLGFEGDPEMIMDKTTEVDLKFTKLIPGTTDSNRTVVQDGQCVGYRYKVSPYIDYSIASNGVATKDKVGDTPVRYIGIGHFGYLNEQVYADGIEFNVDGTSQENFDRNVIALGMGLDYSLVELSSKVNGNGDNKPQAFKLIKLVEPASSNEIGD